MLQCKSPVMAKSSCLRPPSATGSLPPKAEVEADFDCFTLNSRRGTSDRISSAREHPAGIWKKEFEEVSNFLSGIDPVGALLAEHLEDDAAEVSAEGADGLIVLLAFGALSLVVALRLWDSFAMVIDGGHHRRLGAAVDVLWRL